MHVGKIIKIPFESNILVEGELVNILQDNGRILILSIENCKVDLDDEILFLPEWGMYDMTCGGSIISVNGGPADYDNFQKF
mgnify:CR=1 FL=1